MLINNCNNYQNNKREILLCYQNIIKILTKKINSYLDYIISNFHSHPLFNNINSLVKKIENGKK